MVLADNNQFCDNQDNLVTTFLREDVTAGSLALSSFTRFVTTVTTSTRDTRAGTHTYTRTHVGMDVTTSHDVIYNHKTNTYICDNLFLLGCHRLSWLSHRLFFLFRGLYMANEGDLGNDMAQRHLDAALQAHRVVRVVSEECIECGDSISPERQQATGGTQFCFECASLAEKKGRVYR